MDDLTNAWPLLVTAVAAYLLGSIPFGLIVTRLAGLGDVRKIGSGSIGATNVLRTGNKGLAALTLLLDVGKGAAAVLLASRFGSESYALAPSLAVIVGQGLAIVAGLAAILGHMFPVWLGFRGGKGIATGLGIVLAISWPAALAGLATWIVVVVTTRISSLGSIISSVFIIAYVWFLTHNINYVWMMIVLAALVVFKHHSNIGRLWRGEEPKIGRK